MIIRGLVGDNFLGKKDYRFADGGGAFWGESGRFRGVTISVEGGLGGEAEEVDFVGDVGRVISIGWFESRQQFAAKLPHQGKGLLFKAAEGGNIAFVGMEMDGNE